MYRTKAIYQLSDLKQSSLKILRLFKIYRQSGSQAPVPQFDVSYDYYILLLTIHFLNWVRYVNNAKPLNVSAVFLSIACHDVM